MEITLRHRVKASKMPVCLRLKSISSLALAIRKASDSFRFLIVKSRGRAFWHFGKCVLLYLHSEEKKLGERFNCSTLRFIFSIFCRGFAEILELAKGCKPVVLSYQSRSAAFCILFSSPSCGSCRWLGMCQSEVCFWADSSRIFLGKVHPAASSVALGSGCPRLYKI